MEKEKIKKKIQRLIRYNSFYSFFRRENTPLIKYLNKYPEILLWKYDINLIEQEMKNVSLLQYASYFSGSAVKQLCHNDYFIRKEQVYFKEINKGYDLFSEDEDFDIQDNEENNQENGHLFLNELQRSVEYAIKGNNEESLKCLLHEGADINKSWIDSNVPSKSALNLALNNNNYKLAQKLIHVYSADINYIGDALHEAVTKLDIKKINFVLDNGGKENINKLDIKGRPPIALLVLSKKIYVEKVDEKVKEVIDILVNNGAVFEIAWKNNMHKNQEPDSIGHNNEELYANSGNIKFNVLNYLIAKGFIKKDLILYLQNKGAFIDLKNRNSLAGYNNLLNGLAQSNVWKNLSEININIQENPKLMLNYQLYNRGKEVKQYKVINMLLKNGININETIEDKKVSFNKERANIHDSLELAVREKNEDVVKLLLENSASPRNSHYDLLNVIVEKWKSYKEEMKGDYDKKKRYQTWLNIQTVRVNQCIAIFKILIEYGADINLSSSSRIKMKDNAVYTIYPLLWVLPEEFKAVIPETLIDCKEIFKKAFLLYEKNISDVKSIEQLKEKIETQMASELIEKPQNKKHIIDAYLNALEEINNDSISTLIQIHFNERISLLQNELLRENFVGGKSSVNVNGNTRKSVTRL